MPDPNIQVLVTERDKGNCISTKINPINDLEGVTIPSPTLKVSTGVECADLVGTSSNINVIAGVRILDIGVSIGHMVDEEPSSSPTTNSMESAQEYGSPVDYMGILKSHPMSTFLGSSTRRLPIPPLELLEDDYPPLECPQGST